MTSTEKLELGKQEALEICVWRGHSMDQFSADFEGLAQIIATSKCKNCGRKVTINTSPDSNDIYIGGEAVAVNCDKITEEDIEKFTTSEEKEMLEEKKTPPMIKRLIKRKKFKGKITKEDIQNYATEEEKKALNEDIRHKPIKRSAKEQRIREILEWILEILNKPERIGDLWDEEGFPTEELQRFHSKIEFVLGEFRNLPRIIFKGE